MSSNPIIKICGNLSVEHAEKISPLKPDWWGFIFYQPSKRFFKFAPSTLHAFHQGQKVGVFVNHSLEEIIRIGQEAGLDYVQLHGNETPEFCSIIARKFPVIKVFGIGQELNNQLLEKYEPYVDYFLFDTLSPQYGGTGQKFDRNIIFHHYTLSKPYLISGGVDTDEALSVLNATPPHMAGVDMNSKLETSTGEKDNHLIQAFLKQVYAR